MVGVAHARDVRVQRFQSDFGVVRAHGHRLRDLLVDDHVDLHALRGLALEQHVEAPFRVLRRRATQVQFGREPPILKGGPRGRRSVLLRPRRRAPPTHVIGSGDEETKGRSWLFPALRMMRHDVDVDREPPRARKDVMPGLGMPLRSRARCDRSGEPPYHDTKVQHRLD